MATKSKRIMYLTPKGTALFAHIKDPDFGNDKYPIPEGAYRLTLILTEDQSMKLKAKLKDEIERAEEFAQEKYNGLKRSTREKIGKLTINDVCSPEYDRDDNATGNYKWQFKANYKYEDRNSGKKIERHIPVFDSMNQPVQLKDEVGNGSEVRVSFCVNPYFIEGQGMGGLTMYINAIQIAKMVKGGEKNAEYYGFEEDEDGYVSETKEDVASSNKEEEDDSDVPF